MKQPSSSTTRFLHVEKSSDEKKNILWAQSEDCGICLQTFNCIGRTKCCGQNLCNTCYSVLKRHSSMQIRLCPYCRKIGFRSLQVSSGVHTIKEQENVDSPNESSESQKLPENYCDWHFKNVCRSQVCINDLIWIPLKNSGSTKKWNIYNIPAAIYRLVDIRGATGYLQLVTKSPTARKITPTTITLNPFPSIFMVAKDRSK